jgi:hypothetical protein
MINQYEAQRFKGGYNPRHIGTIPTGSIIYIQDNLRPFSAPSKVVKRNPWIVRAWMNRECLGRILKGGHLAVVQSLRDGRTQTVSDWILLRSIDVTE